MQSSAHQKNQLQQTSETKEVGVLCKARKTLPLFLPSHFMQMRPVPQI